MSHVHRPVRRNPDDITFAAIEKIAADEGACLALFEALRFPGGLRCSACGADERQGCGFTRHRSRPGLYTCGGCRRQFSITSGTAMHRTRLPLGQWLRAIWLLSSSSKGISARKLAEMLGLTYKVGWHLCHRIRTMMGDRQISLSGVVEIDEIYAGAPPRKPHGGGPSGVPTGRGPRRPLVLTMVERSGRVVLERIASHSSAAIGRAVAPTVDPAATIITDTLPAYRRVAAGHEHLTVVHSAGQFVVPDAGGSGVDAHTNTAEAVHGMIRRAVIGVWHWISQKHLDRYLDELAWRHNRRKEGHLTRIVDVIGWGGRPLPMKHLVRPI
ncbi:IS1595 family transposase [Paracoccus luteus]|uniref:IS1595 family transposase n=1 Tax=Paracoccus luteus TaxID=2508543 RepID=UPI00106FEFEA|nr:IS1595 family transposase [Paracoccus luteus]